jgi:hypothetical protein
MNKAAELGPQRYPWWPDWRGEAVAIVASGPSIKATDLSVLQDRVHTIVIKRTVERCPWAEVCYGCDAAWWLDQKGLPQFQGIKLFHGVQAANKWPDLRRVEIDMQQDRMLVEEPLRIGNGGNSGFQALNLAIQFGVKDVILIGLDLHNQGGAHWYGMNKWPGANNPAQSNFDRWSKGFDKAKHDVDRLGVTVVNTSMESAVKCFRKAKLNDIMQEWGL